MGVVLLSACTGAKPAATPSPTPQETAADIRLAQLLSVLEQTLFAGYSSVNSAILSRSLAASDATRQLVQSCQSHHHDHIAQWTAALTLAPADPLRMNDPLLATQLNAVRKAKTESTALTALMTLETVVMQTYAQRSGEIMDPDFRHLASSIGPVEAQHLTAFALLSHHQSLLPSSPTAAGDQARPASDIPSD
jgi:hypothetical protein